MFGVTTSDDYKPVTWVGRFPVDVTTLLVGLHSVLAVILCLLWPTRLASLATYFYFDSSDILSGQIWRLVTYAFVHPPSQLLWFAIEMYMLYVFGREVEKFIGRRAFIVLYALLLLAPAIIVTLWGVMRPIRFSGSGQLHFAVFVAFATIYPETELFLGIRAKWVALVLGAIGVLSAFAVGDWVGLVILTVTFASAFIFIRARGVGSELMWWENLKARLQPKPKFKVVPKPAAPRRTEEDVYESVDPILEKIAKSGIGSLTPNERRQLDRARNRLLKESR